MKISVIKTFFLVEMFGGDYQKHYLCTRDRDDYIVIH